METITHLRNVDNIYALCGERINCALTEHVKVHHCFTANIEKVSCADCADIYARREERKQTINELFGKNINDVKKPILQADLFSALKMNAAKDKEIAELERVAKVNQENLAKARKRRDEYGQKLLDTKRELAQFTDMYNEQTRINANQRAVNNEQYKRSQEQWEAMEELKKENEWLVAQNKLKQDEVDNQVKRIAELSKENVQLVNKCRNLEDRVERSNEIMERVKVRAYESLNLVSRTI